MPLNRLIQQIPVDSVIISGVSCFFIAVKQDVRLTFRITTEEASLIFWLFFIQFVASKGLLCNFMGSNCLYFAKNIK